MTKTQIPTRSSPADTGGGAWTGWVVFASIMLAVVGGLNFLQGIVALLNDDYFVVRSGNDLLIADFNTWGWVLLIWGAAQALTSFGLNAGAGWARVTAIIIACVSMFIQIAFLAAYPLWSIAIIAMDVIIIFALTARWSEARDGL
jgi:hypothetical protein